MSPKKTFAWFLLAAVVFAFIQFHQRHARPGPVGPENILPGLKPEDVTSLSVRRAGKEEMRADRTNGTWQLARPITYPAQTVSIENLVEKLSQLTAATSIGPGELKGRTGVDEEFGFNVPQAWLQIQQGDTNISLLIGAPTPLGDQVYIQVVKREGIFIADAAILGLIPKTPDDWRDTTFLTLKASAFDRIILTNGNVSCELARNPTNRLWRMISPIPARADTVKIEDALQKLLTLSIRKFVPDSPKPDFETLGLQPPELSLALAQGAISNVVAQMQFGKSPSNDYQQVFALRAWQQGVVTVSRDALTTWRLKSVNDLRDPHIITLTEIPDAIDVHADENFTLQRQTNGSWLVQPQNYPADLVLLRNLILSLSTMSLAFVKDNVTPPDLPAFGLASPRRQYILRSGPTNAPAGTPGAVMAEISFGTNQADRVYVNRTDEPFVGSVSTNDFQQLPSAAWQMRERRLWHFDIESVSRVVIHQNGKVRQIIRNSTNSWSLATQGIINDLAVEEAVGELIQAGAAIWTARGASHLQQYGFREGNLQITIDLKDGSHVTIDFGGRAESGLPFASVKLGDEVYVFELPAAVAQYVMGYLTIPANVP